MTLSAAIRHDIGYLSTLPLGSIIAWHRDLLEDRVLELPPGWVECNGQTLDDPQSPFHKSVIPNLNLVDREDALAGHEGGAFLRGAPRSGAIQQDQLQTHSHQDRGHRHFRNPDHAAELAWRNVSPQVGSNGVPALGPDRFFNLDRVETATANLGEPTAFGPSELRHGAETRPVNMSVIWIIKVKQITAARALPAVLAHGEAPQGAVYVDQSGRVGVGTSKPAAEVDVAGTVRATSFQGDGSELSNVPCACFEILASGSLEQSGRITTVQIGERFVGFLTVVARGGSGSYSSIHHYLALGQSPGPDRQAQVGELGAGLVGSFDGPIRVDVVLEPGTVGAVEVVARAADSGGGMSYRVVGRAMQL